MPDIVKEFRFSDPSEPDDDQKRRAEDVLTTKIKTTDRTLGAAFLIFLIALLYKLIEVLRLHTTYNDFATPAGAGELLESLLYGLAALALALGINVKRLIKGFLE